jgi:ATP-dependent exoDNAse (exonuclease V) alpha subunit
VVEVLGAVVVTELTSEQLDAADAVRAFVAEPRLDHSCFVLHGLAGTGKTTLMSHLARENTRAVLLSPTGKAASVLRRRSGLPVSTVHSAIYDFRGLVDDQDIQHKKNPIFASKIGLDFRDRVLLLDECSMCGLSIANDLLATGARVVACGDPGQLPPVMDQQYFTEPDVTLSQIHRQALESPIIRQAHSVREYGSYETDTDDFRVISFAESEDLLAADVLLCWTNSTRKKLNRKKRQLLGLTGALKAGEPLMCLRNDYARKIQNGAIYRLIEDRREKFLSIRIKDDDDREVFVPQATIENESSFEVLKYNDKFTPFAAAYAATVHKSQGSEWPSVLLLDEHPYGAGRVPFLYTGITRSIERCTIVSWR